MPIWGNRGRQYITMITVELPCATPKYISSFLPPCLFYLGLIHFYCLLF